MARPGPRGVRFRWDPSRKRKRRRFGRNGRALTAPTPAPRPRLTGRGVLAERTRSGTQIVSAERHQLGALEIGELRSLHSGQAQRLGVEGLFEERAREAG